MFRIRNYKAEPAECLGEDDLVAASGDDLVVDVDGEDDLVAASGDDLVVDVDGVDDPVAANGDDLAVDVDGTDVPGSIEVAVEEDVDVAMTVAVDVKEKDVSGAPGVASPVSSRLRIRSQTSEAELVLPSSSGNGSDDPMWSDHDGETEDDEPTLAKLVNAAGEKEFCVDVGVWVNKGDRDSEGWKERYDVSAMEMSDPKITSALIIAYPTSDVELVEINGDQFQKILCIDKRTRSPVFVFVQHSLGNAGQIFKEDGLFEVMPEPLLDERHHWLRNISAGLIVATRCYSWFPKDYSR
jgi:hypothetical protein